MTVEATAHLDATATTAAAVSSGDGGLGYSNTAARVCLMLMKRVYGGPPHGHTAEPVIDVLASQLDLSAPRPKADHRQAAQQPNNRREYGGDEDVDGAASGAVQRALGAVQRARRPLRGRQRRQQR